MFKAPLNRREALARLAAFTLTGTCPAAFAQQEPIRIGFLAALSGPQAVGGIKEREAAEFGIDELNKAGGINGRQVKLYIEDNQTSAQVGLTRLNKLIHEDKVSLIMGDTGSAVMAYSPILARVGVPFIFNGGTLPVTEHGNKWLFRTVPSDRYVTSAILTYLRVSGQGKRVALLTETSAYGEGARQLIEERIKKGDLGMSIVASEAFQINDVDLTAQVTKIKASNPDAIILWGASAASAIALRNASNIGMKVPTFGSLAIVQPGMLDAAGPGREGLIAASVGLVPGENAANVKSAPPILQHFAKGFSAKYPNREISFWELMAYDGVLVAADALRRAGSDDRAKIRDALDGVSNLSGTLGKYTYSPSNRDGAKEDSVVLMQYRAGKWSRLWPS